MGLNITVMSYCGHMDFGIVADRDQMPDVRRLIDWLEDSLAELEEAAVSPHDRPGPRVADCGAPVSRLVPRRPGVGPSPPQPSGTGLGENA